MPRIPRGRTPRKLLYRGAWFTRPGVRERVERDAAQVTSAYPALALKFDEEAGAVYLEGSIVHREAVSGIPTPISLRIVLREGYPQKEPRAYETAGLFEHGNLDGHVLSDGKLCLWLPMRSQWHGLDPEHPWSWRDPDALLRFVDQVLVFAERHLIWQVTRKWPGGQSAHGTEGYVEYIREALGCSTEDLAGFAAGFGKRDAINVHSACPCGSGKMYRFCHRGRVRKLRQECGRIAPEAFDASRSGTP